MNKINSIKKGGDKMYKKIFELINEKLNSILENENSYELKKLEIRGNKVKFVFLDNGPLATKVKVINFEINWFNSEPKLKFKNDYLKPYTDIYFR